MEVSTTIKIATQKFYEIDDKDQDGVINELIILGEDY